MNRKTKLAIGGVGVLATATMTVLLMQTPEPAPPLTPCTIPVFGYGGEPVGRDCQPVPNGQWYRTVERQELRLCMPNETAATLPCSKKIDNQWTIVNPCFDDNATCDTLRERTREFKRLAEQLRREQ